MRKRSRFPVGFLPKFFLRKNILFFSGCQERFFPFWQKRQTNGRLKGTLAGYPAVSPASHAASLLPSELSPGPNRRRLFCVLWREPGSAALSLLPVICSNIHSQTACRASPPKRRLWRMPFNEEDCLCNLPGVGHANSFAAGRRLARRPCRRRQSRAPQEGLRSKFKSVPPFSPCYGGVALSFSSTTWVLSPGFIRHQTLPSPPAPRTHPVPPFRLFRVGFAFCPLSPRKSSGMILWLGWRPLSLSSTEKAGIAPGLFPFYSAHAVLPV